MAILSKFSNNKSYLLAWEDSLPVPFRVLPVLSKVPSVGSLPNGWARDLAFFFFLQADVPGISGSADVKI